MSCSNIQHLSFSVLCPVYRICVQRLCGVWNMSDVWNLSVNLCLVAASVVLCVGPWVWILLSHNKCSRGCVAHSASLFPHTVLLLFSAIFPANANTNKDENKQACFSRMWPYSQLLSSHTVLLLIKCYRSLNGQNQKIKNQNFWSKKWKKMKFLSYPRSASMLGKVRLGYDLTQIWVEKIPSRNRLYLVNR